MNLYLYLYLVMNVSLSLAQMAGLHGLNPWSLSVYFIRFMHSAV